MGLSLEQAKEIIKSQPNKDLLVEACFYEDWVKLHSEFVHDLSTNYGYINIKAKLNALIGDKKKVDTLDIYITSPSTTKKLIGKVKTGHAKMFDGKNPYTKYLFEGREEQRAKLYLDEIGFDNYIREKIFNDYYNAPCSFYVIDMPIESVKTTPYVTDVACRNVYSAEYNDKGKLTYVSFGSDVVRRVYCDEYYRVFDKMADGEFHLTHESTHILGFCPAFQMSEPLNKENPFKRWSPLTDYLNDLDYVIIYEAMLKVFEAYGPFPIITKFAADCSYDEFVGVYQDDINHGSGQERFNKCNGGFMHDYLGHTVTQNGKPKKCPVCVERYYMAPGSLDIVPQPRDDKGASALLDSPRIKNVDIDGLNYTFDKVKERKQELEEGLIGKIDLPDNKSVNESQVLASFERKREILSVVKKPIEKAKIDLGGAILTLLMPTFKKVEHSLGTDFHIMAASDLMSVYNISKEQGHSESILNFLFEEYLYGKYRNDHAKLVEAVTWFHVDPWPHSSMMEIMTLNAREYLDGDSLLLKANLSHAINSFNDENNVVIFGEFLSPRERINKIKTKLINYVRIKKKADGLALHSTVQTQNSQPTK